MPRSRVGYWRAKFDRTMERDGQNTAKLREMGWNVVIIWECETDDEGRLKVILAKVFRAA